MNNNKQSSVEWAIEKITMICAFYNRKEMSSETFNYYHKDIVQKAKAMQREDMIGLIEWMNEIAKTDPMRLETDNDDIVDMYYNETYGGEK